MTEEEVLHEAIKTLDLSRFLPLLFLVTLRCNDATVVTQARKILKSLLQTVVSATKVTVSFSKT